MRPTINKEQELTELEKQKAAYYKKGGKVTKLPPMEFTYRLCTVKTAGSSTDLMLYTSKYDAIMGRGELMKVKKGGRFSD